MIEVVTCDMQTAVDREVDKIADAVICTRATAVTQRLVFLDFDGVLNHGAFFSAQIKDEWADGKSFDLACVARLNRLLAETGAVVVVSSSWRIDRTVSQLRKVLADHGFVGTVIGKTPVLRGQRGDEIRAWLNALPQPTRRFVVLDDNSDMDAVREHFVKTKFHGDAEHGGLTEAKVTEVLELFRRLDAPSSVRA